MWLLLPLMTPTASSLDAFFENPLTNRKRSRDTSRDGGCGRGFRRHRRSFPLLPRHVPGWRRRERILEVPAGLRRGGGSRGEGCYGEHDIEMNRRGWVYRWVWWVYGMEWVGCSERKCNGWKMKWIHGVWKMNMREWRWMGKGYASISELQRRWEESNEY